MSAEVDSLPGSQETINSHWHAMRDPNWSIEEARNFFNNYVQDNLDKCTWKGLARALHAIQDSYTPSHSGFQIWSGMDETSLFELIFIHGSRDIPFPGNNLRNAAIATRRIIKKFLEECECPK